MILFDRVFAEWLISESWNERLLVLAKDKGFSSIAEWRLNTCKILGLDRLSWSELVLSETDALEIIPKVLIGPYPGWQRFFDEKLKYTFKQGFENQEFFNFVKNHDRIPQLVQDFPKVLNLIVVRFPDGGLMHIEGGHRMCAVSFAINENLDLKLPHKVKFYVADVGFDFRDMCLNLLRLGTGKN